MTSYGGIFRQNANADARLAAIVAQDKDAQVLIGADAKASYQTVTDAIDVLKKAGVEKVSLISSPKGSSK